MWFESRKIYFRKIFLIFIVFILFSSFGLATSHYTFEHAEEMRTSGRIEWREYGPDAFNEAIKQNKPIFLLLTAPSWCYWCHVYTSDEYVYQEDIYPIINEKFIPIYVDADKRQDLTRKYLEGGWPSTTVLSPGLERLFGYSGPRPIYFMQSNLNQAIDFVDNTGFSNKISHNYEKENIIIPTNQQLNNLVNGYASYNFQLYDPVNGGFGTGQKFPQGKTLDFSLDIYEVTRSNEFLSMVQNTLRNQYTKIDEIETNYNLFDPVEGGFHRYGTQRDWTPPHYEKMLYDNVKLLKAYAHLLQINPDDELVKEVVDKTKIYIETQWYDEESGGFYGNTDVHGEDNYYGKNPRPMDKPRVEKTKYSDWNSEAIITYLYLWESTGDEKYRVMVEKSLDFFSKEVVTTDGIYHFVKEDGTRGVRGSILDYSNLLMAFSLGYESLGKAEYLEIAQQIADLSLENLYDWNSGGFFERNSPDLDLYAPGENVDLLKPTDENGIMAFSFLKLYEQTKEIKYLNAGIKTLGRTLNQAGGLDRGYYIVQASRLALELNLIEEYNSKQIEIKKIEDEKLEQFWVNNLISNQEFNLVVNNFVVSNEGLEKIEGPTFILLIVAFFAGLLSFLSPCTLPILPAYVAYIFKASKMNIRGMTLSFFLGLAVVFSLLGMSATFIGIFLKKNLEIFSQVTGVLIIIFGLFILFGKGFTGLKIKQNKPTTYLGSFIFGCILGLSWTPCIGPILVAILLLASTSGSVITGGFLMFTYAVGLALPLIIFSTYLSKVEKDGKMWKFIRGKELNFSIFGKEIGIHTTTLISAILFIILGYLIFSGLLFSFNQYVGTSFFQKWIFLIEDKLLSLLK